MLVGLSQVANGIKKKKLATGLDPGTTPFGMFVVGS
jgi:hypothetical protein